MHERTECPHCGSSDNRVWMDDHYWCYSPQCRERQLNEFVGSAKGVRVSDSKKIFKPIKLDSIRLPKRRLLATTCAKYNVGAHQGQVHLPYYQNGVVVGYKVRNPKVPKKNKGHFYVKGSVTNVLFGNQCVHNKNIIALCSGEYDAMSIFQMCGVSAVSLPNDSVVENTVLQNLEWLEKFEKVILCIDNDEAGQVATEKAASIIRPYQVYRMVFPTGYKDANDMLMASQTELFKRAFWAAKPTPIKTIFSGDELRQELKTRHETPKGISTGIDELDHSLGGLRAGELTVVLAKTYQGKSTFSRIVFSNLLRSKVKSLVVALEERPEKYARRLLHTYIGRPVQELSPTERDFLIDDMLSNLQLSKLNGEVTPKELSDCIEYSIRRDKVKCILIDNVSAGADPSHLFEHTSKLIKTLFDLCKELNVHIVAVCHVHRGGELGLESGYGSSAIERNTDNIITVARDEEDDFKVNIEVIKNRELGGNRTPITKIFNPHTGRYEESIRTETKQIRKGNQRQLPSNKSLIKI